MSTLVDKLWLVADWSKMATKPTTQEKLLLHGRRLFWARGYSNVSVRQVASAAGVDVALISRHFGGKLGLFETTMAGAFDLSEMGDVDQDMLVDIFVRLFLETPRGGEDPSVLRLLLTNAHDEEVGEYVRTVFQAAFHQRLVGVTGSQERAAMFISVLLGMSVVEKSLHLPGVDGPGAGCYEAQLRHMMSAALSFTPA